MPPLDGRVRKGSRAVSSKRALERERNVVGAFSPGAPFFDGASSVLCRDDGWAPNLGRCAASASPFVRFQRQESIWDFVLDFEGMGFGDWCLVSGLFERAQKTRAGTAAGGLSREDSDRSLPNIKDCVWKLQPPVRFVSPQNRGTRIETNVGWSRKRSPSPLFHQKVCPRNGRASEVHTRGISFVENERRLAL